MYRKTLQSFYKDLVINGICNGYCSLVPTWKRLLLVFYFITLYSFKKFLRFNPTFRSSISLIMNIHILLGINAIALKTPGCHTNNLFVWEGFFLWVYFFFYLCFFFKFSSYMYIKLCKEQTITTLYKTYHE